MPMENLIKFPTGKPLALLLAVCLAATAGTAAAQEERKTKQTVAMSQQVYEKLSEVQELVEAKDYAGAENILREMRNSDRLSDYERAQIWNLTGYSYYLQERYDDAINAYEQVMRQPDLPEALQLAHQHERLFGQVIERYRLFLHQPVVARHRQQQRFGE